MSAYEYDTCGRCGLSLADAPSAGGWAASGPGVRVHRDEADCGEPLPATPLPQPRTSAPWPRRTP